MLQFKRFRIKEIFNGLNIQCTCTCRNMDENARGRSCVYHCQTDSQVRVEVVNSIECRKMYLSTIMSMSTTTMI